MMHRAHVDRLLQLTESCHSSSVALMIIRHRSYDSTSQVCRMAMHRHHQQPHLIGVTSVRDQHMMKRTVSP